MARPCSICANAKRTAIDRMLDLGKSPSEISRRYPVSPDAVQRHRKHLVSQNNAEHIAAESRHASGPHEDFENPLDIPVVLDTRVPKGTVQLVQQGRVVAEFDCSAGAHHAPPCEEALQNNAPEPVVELTYYNHVISYPDYEVSVSPETPVEVLKQGLPYIRRAVRLAGDNRLEQERLVAILNEALQSEHMGLD